MASFKISNLKNKYTDDDAVRSVLQYCQNTDKTAGYIGGWAINPSNAYTEMILFSKAANQYKGKRLRHYIIAFRPETIKSPKQLYELAKDITEFYADDYQIVFALHFDKPHPHIHIVFNMINYRTLSRYPDKKAEFYRFYNHVKSMLYKHKIRDYLQYVPPNDTDDDF